MEQQLMTEQPAELAAIEQPTGLAAVKQALETEAAETQEVQEAPAVTEPPKAAVPKIPMNRKQRRAKVKKIHRLIGKAKIEQNHAKMAKLAK